MSLLVSLLLFLAFFTAESNAANYCLCKDGGDQALQKTIDYACGNGADCTPIIQNGACYNPNTVKDHCSYAANSYYQRKVSSGATCDFGGAATLSANPPPNAPANCYQGASGSTTPTTPSTNPNNGNTGNTGISPPTGINNNPSTGGGFSPPGTVSPTGGNTFNTPPGVLGPTSLDGSGATSSFSGMNLFFATLALFFSGPFLLWACMQ